MGRAHTGICRQVKSFRTPWLEEVAFEVEELYSAEFARFGFALKAVPIQVSHLRAVGEGVQLAVDPIDSDASELLGEFESDLEVIRRVRGSAEFQQLRSGSEVKEWASRTVTHYLRVLRSAEESGSIRPAAADE